MIDVLDDPPWRKSRARVATPAGIVLPRFSLDDATLRVDPIVRDELISRARRPIPNCDADGRTCMRKALVDDALFDGVEPTKWCFGRDSVFPLFFRMKRPARVFRLVQVVEYRNQLFELLPFIGTSWALPFVLDAYVRLPSVARPARDWLGEWPLESARVLVPFALGVSFEDLGLGSVIAKAPRPLQPAHGAAALGHLANAGFGDVIRAVAKEASVLSECEALLAESTLRGKPLPKAKLTYAPAAQKQAIERPQAPLAKGKRLSDEQVTALFELCQLVSWEMPPPEIAIMMRVLDPESRARFFDALLATWLERGAPKHELWIANACAQFGDDASIDLLAQTAVEWKAAYAGTSAEPMKALATMVLTTDDAGRRDRALAALGAIAMKGRSRSQERVAREILAETATALGLPAESLDDRYLPTLGFDSKGEQRIGNRVARLDPNLEPHLFDDEGHRIETPSAPEWKALKKTMRSASGPIVRRIESWLRDRETWSVADFRTYLLGHPIWRQIARGLLWTDGTQAMRVAEDGSFANVDDETIDVAGRVGLAHPAELAPAVLARWGQVFGDYEIMQPIAQLAWPIVRLSEAEAKGQSLGRYIDRELDYYSEDGGYAVSHDRHGMERRVGKRHRIFLRVDRQTEWRRARYRIVDVGIQGIAALSFHARIAFEECEAGPLSEALCALEGLLC